MSCGLKESCESKIDMVSIVTQFKSFDPLDAHQNHKNKWFVKCIVQCKQKIYKNVLYCQRVEFSRKLRRLHCCLKVFRSHVNIFDFFQSHCWTLTTLIIQICLEISSREMQNAIKGLKNILRFIYKLCRSRPSKFQWRY